MKVVIDFSAIVHRIRRAIWKLCCFASYESECSECGTDLTDDEFVHYGRTCERCEGINHARGYE